VTTIRPGLDAAARAAVSARTEALLRRTGALNEDGGQRTIDARRILEDPLAATDLVGFWTARLRDRDGVALVDLVVGLAGPGATLAFEAGRQLGVPCAFHPDRMSAITVGARVLLVDAVRVADGVLADAVAAVEAAGGETVECVVVADVADERASLMSSATGRVYPYRALWRARARES
jgi:adenine/guanine phosphoribosyltransferase-like PRPP-binding protein